MGERRFVNETIPAGTSVVVYRVRSLRSTGEGEMGEHVQNLSGPGKRAGEMAKFVPSRGGRGAARAAA